MIIIILISGNVTAQKSFPDTAFATKIENEIKVNGILDEPEWLLARKISNFQQRETKEGEPVTEKTEVALLFNNNKLWIGIWCWDREPDKLVRKEMIRDFQYWRDDNFEVIFDTYLDKRNGFVFVINPNGAMADVQITNEGNGFNPDWNTVWDAETKINKDGWFAEIEIPFSSLKFPNQSDQIWGINFERNIRRKQEAAFWQGWSRNYDFEHVSHAGTLLGLKDIYSKELFEIKPFVSGGIQQDRGKKFEYFAKFGADANVFITPSLKLNLTYNTDFAQVESDQLQYNLTRFNLFFPEKRDIFLEGKDFFNFNIDPNTRTFYSRKIGINKLGYEKPILGGLKLTGNYDRTSVGIMSFQDETDSTNQSSNYSIIRIKQDFLEKSSVGMIFTSFMNSKQNNYVWGIDFNYFTSKLFGDKNFSFGGYITQSIENNNPNENYAYSLNSSFRNDIINAGIQFSNLKEGYNPAIGFKRRSNYKLFNYDFTYKIRIENSNYFQYFYISPLNTNLYFTDNTNQLESRTYNSVPLGLLTKGGDLIDLRIKKDYDRVDEKIENLGIEPGNYDFINYGLEFNSFEGRWWKCEMSYFTGEFYNAKNSDLYTAFRLNVNQYLAFNMEYSKSELVFENNSILKNYYSFNTEIGFSPKLFSKIYIQYLDITKEIMFNYRLHWTISSGNEFYFVVNQRYHNQSNLITVQNTNISAKLVLRLPVSI